MYFVQRAETLPGHPLPSPSCMKSTHRLDAMYRFLKLTTTSQANRTIKAHTTASAKLCSISIIACYYFRHYQKCSWL